jgi:hypothetical protein
MDGHINIDFSNAANTAQLLEILKHIDDSGRVNNSSTRA